MCFGLMLAESFSYIKIIKYMIYKLLLLLLNLALISGLTRLSTANCPSQFSIPDANITKDDTIFKYGAFLYSGFQSESNKARIQAIVVGGNTKDLQTYQTQLMAPYIIFGIVFLLFYLGIIVCCLFDRSCPPCDSLRRNLDEQPYSTKQKRLATFFTLLFALAILIICIIAVSYVPKLKEYANLSTCSIYIGIDTVINGDQSWGGFIQLRNNVGNITNLLSAAVTQIEIQFTDDAWLVDQMSSMQNANLNIYNNFLTSQLVTPNPDTTKVAANAAQAVPKVDSLFIKQGMGPNATANRMVTDIDLGLRTTSKLSNKAYEISKSANLLKQSKNTILSNSQSSQNTLLMYIRQLEVMTTQYDAINQKYFDDYFTFALSLFQGIFAFVLTGSLIAILGVIATNIFDVNICRGMVHLAWSIYGLSYIGVIVIAFIMLSMGSVGYGFCNYYSSMLTKVDIYNTLGAAYTQHAFKRLDTCIFGTGNALEKFSLANEMNTVQELFTNIQTYFDYTNTISNNYVNLGISTSKISGWISAIQKYRLGIYNDSDPIITNNDNPNYALGQLNTYTYDVNLIPRDIWVWDKVNCTNPSQTTYQTSTTSGVTLSPTATFCISFNQKIIDTASNSWSISDIATRYLIIRQSQAARYQNIYDYASTLISYRDSRINLFQAIKDSLNTLYTQNTNFNTRMNTFKQAVTRFYSAVSTLNNLITNSLNGLIKTSNCKSIGDKMRFTYNVFCVNFMSEVVKVGMCTCLLLVLMFGGMVAGSRFGMIFAELQKQKRINMPDEPHSQKDIKQMNMNRTEQSASSNSNDDD